MANMTRYSPFDETFDDLLKGFFVRPVPYDNTVKPQVDIRMDVSEAETEYLVHAEIPGVKKEDIHVTIDASEKGGVLGKAFVGSINPVQLG